MKILVQEVENEGLESLIGKEVCLFCGVYIYHGTLVGVNATCVKLGEDAGIVYETGELNSSTFKDKQKFGKEWYVNTSFVESFGVWKVK